MQHERGAPYQRGQGQRGKQLLARLVHAHEPLQARIPPVSSHAQARDLPVLLVLHTTDPAQSRMQHQQPG